MPQGNKELKSDLPFSFPVLWTASIPNKQNRPDRPSTAKWTVMVYMAADNNLDGAALRDIAEMASVGSSRNVNIVVQLDRAEDRITRRLYITNTQNRPDTLDTDCVETFKETDTGDPRVLENFMLWAMEKYPACRYFLILWNRGGGWWEDPGRSIAYDDSSGGDGLDNKELKRVLTNRFFRSNPLTGKKTTFAPGVRVSFRSGRPIKRAVENGTFIKGQAKVGKKTRRIKRSDRRGAGIDLTPRRG